MKRIILTFAIVMASFAANAQFIRAELLASGLTCSMCSFATQKQLAKLDFIDSIGTDLEHTTFLLYFKKDKKVDVDLIRKKVEDAGFSVAKLTMYYQFQNFDADENQHFVFENNMYHIHSSNKTILTGEIALIIMDKGFLSDKEYAAFQTQNHEDHNMRMENVGEINRVYHIVIK